MSIRRDLRDFNEMRSMTVDMGFINEAEGSARCRMGETNVVAAAYFGAARFQRQERYDRATLDLELRMCGFTGQDAMDTEKSHLQFLTPPLTAAIALEKYPRQVIQIKVTVIHDDGGVLVCALHAAALAIVNAGLEMRSVPVAVSLCTKRIPGDKPHSKSSVAFLVDPTREEDEEAAKNPDYNMVGVDDAHLHDYGSIFLVLSDLFSDDPRVTSTRITGCLSANTLRRGLQLAMTVGKTAAAAMQHVMGPP